MPPWSGLAAGRGAGGWREGAPILVGLEWGKRQGMAGGEGPCGEGVGMGDNRHGSSWGPMGDEGGGGWGTLQRCDGDVWVGGARGGSVPTLHFILPLHQLPALPVNVNGAPL